jgi:membrane protease YdiL (CAAX protease family)
LGATSEWKFVLMAIENSSIAPWRQRLRDSRLLIVLELAMVAAVYVADQRHLIYFSKVPYLLALGWISMAVRGVRWRDLGLRLDPRWMMLLFAGLIAGVAMEALELFVTQPLLVKLTGNYPDLSSFHSLIGNLKLLLILIAFAWVVAGVGEEMVWRGYLMNRVADLVGRSKAGWTVSLVLVSATFGLAHFQQGLTGVVENSIAGVFLGLLYLASGRNLIVPIIAHGFGDTVDFLIIYSGHYPGM